ncbi:Receptor-like serine/threonine-protein kinase [Heracleum sosnowskyi]|uniref:Receptor-like serine/threonine-protein kinase n=1 Tax=Heracleum sosnowskyi TaxID=360622 RepID=A0AAD8JKC4_9APIA|nr:Receptor-like serine/threonine-protein kinase [Heracleum sosnowskyi]
MDINAFMYVLSTASPPVSNNMYLRSKKTSLYLLVLLLFVLFFETRLNEGTNVITIGQTLSGNETISSENGTFELGFFTPGKSQNYYIGIWYKRFASKTVVWVANRNHPVLNPYNSELKLLQNGNLVLLNESRIQIWSSNSTSKTDNSNLAILFDNGNFVTRDIQDSSNVIWQSFDYPTDTWLPGGGKVGYNKIKKEKIYLTPWKNAEDPAPSIFSLELEPNRTSHNLMYNRTIQYWSTGEWTGTNFVVVPEIDRNSYIKNLKYISNVNESKFTYDIGFPKILTRFMIDVTGQLRQFIFREGQWVGFWARPGQCEVLKFCGAFGTCNQLKEPYCNCLQEYEPKVSKNWALGEYTDGCIRRSSFKCGVGRGEDTFLSIKKMRFSFQDTGDAHSLDVESDKECKSACLRNCSCTGYVFNGGKCVVWNGEIYNFEELAPADSRGEVFHLRITKSKKTSKIIVWIVVGAIGGSFILLGMVTIVLLRLRKRKLGDYDGKAGDLMLFKYKDIKKSTDDFSEKLGEGGFGSVFKGTLPNSTDIAVKRLKNLKQGEKQFRAEIGKRGRRNRDLLEDGDYFPALVAEKLSKGEEVLKLLDQKLEGDAVSSEVDRAFKVACWCIQDDEKNRPTMGLVIQILEGISEAGIPPIPRFLLGFTGDNKSRPIVYQQYTFDTTSSSS